MAFVAAWPSCSNLDVNIKVDIIGVPAIGADPNNTWSTSRSGNPYEWLGPGLRDEIPSARILLYDHLEPWERALEVKPRDDPSHKDSAEQNADVQGTIARYGFTEWTDRLLVALHRSRDSGALKKRPIIFVCHSTGGVIVKQALTRAPCDGHESLAAVRIGITFLATPHHGSSVLSRPNFAQTVQKNLKLKWEMSEHLREGFAVQNYELERLNCRFGAAALGIKIWTYVEHSNTMLQVLIPSDAGGKTLRLDQFLVVNRRSATLSTSDMLIEEEEVFHLSTDHMGVAQFGNEEAVRDRYCRDLKDIICNISAQDRAAHHALTTSIMTGIRVNVHQFYQIDIPTGSTAMTIWSEYPTLKKFLDVGPSECLKKRLPTLRLPDQPVMNGVPKLSIQLRHASEPVAPTTSVAPPGEDTSNSPTQLKASGLVDPPFPSPKTISTRGPSLGVESAEKTITSHLKPMVALPTLPGTTTYPDADQARRPQRPLTFQFPSKERNRFRWVHVPYTNAGWVPQILTTISQEEGNSNLHSKLLSDQIWISQHNRPRHASPHARFVRSSSKTLLPKSSPGHHIDKMLSPSSAVDQIQFVLYLPYLHWDSFKHLQDRARVIQKRRRQPHAQPVDPTIVTGKSMESKLIWQYLSYNRPIHCRRTLDQYGYPTLRNTAARDGDQVLYKRTRPAVDSAQSTPRESAMHSISDILRTIVPTGHHSMQMQENDGAAKVLMVDQLWLWVLDDQTVVTFASPKENEDNDGELSEQGDLRRAMYKDAIGIHGRRCDDCFDFAALTVFHAVRALLDGTTDTNLQVFRIFEEYISILTEQQTTSFKEFRDNHRNRGPRDSDVHRLPKYSNNRADLDALLELRDIEDELSIIEKLLKEQHRSIREMLHQYNDLTVLHRRGMHGLQYLHATNLIVEEYKEQVDAMLGSARAAQKAFKELLDMKQKQANIIEAHLTRKQTEVAADQSRSVMIFTIFTIIFLPLSFLATVFGINAREWSGVAGNPSLSEIFKYMGSISLAVIVVALLVAFNRATRRLVQKIWKVMAKGVASVLSKVTGRRYVAISSGRDEESLGERTSVSRIELASSKKKNASRGRYKLY